MIRLNLPDPRTGKPRRTTKPKHKRFAGAGVSRLTSDWVTQPTSADRDIRWNLMKLRARARALVRDNPYASRFVNLVAENVIGMYGIEAQPANKLGGRMHRTLNTTIKDAWQDWGRPASASVDGRQSWIGQQQLAARAWPADGEVFLRLVGGFGNPYSFAVQMIDPDLCDQELNTQKTRTQNEIRMGVELDRWGRPVAYWFWTRHPFDLTPGPRTHERIPAEQIVHLYAMMRPGQTRGYPWFAPILLDTNMLGGYTEAELVAARTAASAMGFFSTDPEAEDDVEDEEDSQGETPAMMDAEPGTFWKLRPGTSVHEWSPEHPNAAFEMFAGTVLRGIAAGLNVSYASLTGDLRNANYSSARVGSLQERDGWEMLQHTVIEHVCDRVYATWGAWAALAGALAIGTRNFGDVGAVLWQPRGWPWVDPLKDIEAAEKEIQLGINSRTSVCLRMGRDFEEVLDELKTEQALADEAGVSITPPVPGSAPTKDGTDGTDTTDSTDAGRALRLAAR